MMLGAMRCELLDIVTAPNGSIHTLSGLKTGRALSRETPFLSLQLVVFSSVKFGAPRSRPSGILKVRFFFDLGYFRLTFGLLGTLVKPFLVC